MLTLAEIFFSEQTTMSNDWHSEDVECQILDGHENASDRGKTCVIKTVSGPTCSVWIQASDQTVTVGCDNLKPVQPQKNHKVIDRYGAGNLCFS